MPKISVVMAAYNHAAFVRAAIESVLSQSFQDFELVITDDGSGDGTVEAIRAVADPRIRLEVLASNQGACVAMNAAIRRAQGEYLAVLNSDDFFLPGKLERQAGYLDAHPGVGAVFGLPQFVDQRGRPFRNPGHAFNGMFPGKNQPRREWLRSFFQHGNSLCHPTILVRRSCYDKIGLYDPLLMQLPDLDQWVRLCQEYEIHVLPETLTAFRILDGERNTSTPSAPRLARTAWETGQVLGHYASLPEAELRAIFPAGSGADGAYPPRVRLALDAIKLGRPGYGPFGLELLRQCLREDPRVFPGAEYFRLVGETDPYSVGYFAREHQWLRRSRFLGAVRGFSRWCRSLNLPG